jgi:hypothetical protein
VWFGRADPLLLQVSVNGPLFHKMLMPGRVILTDSFILPVKYSFGGDLFAGSF